MSSKDNIQPNWRPDFKIESTLPDIKIIRTDFAINSIVLVLALIASALLVQREYSSHLLRRSIGDLEQQVQSNSKENTVRLKKSEQFRKLGRNIEELQRFFQVPFLAHELIVELALLKPENVIFSRVELSESVTKVSNKAKNRVKPKVVYEVNIAGDVQDLPILAEFKHNLEESSLLSSKGFVVSVDESMQQRNVEMGIIPFQITVSFASASNTISDKGTKK